MATMSRRAHPQPRFDDLLCFPLYAATRAVTRRYATLLDGTGLTYPQYLVLLVLWEADEPMTVTALGHRLRLDSGTLTPLLKRLEAASLVERNRDPDDERRVLVSLTADGRAMEQRVADVPRRLGETMSITYAEVDALRDQLYTLIDKLDAAASG